MQNKTQQMQDETLSRFATIFKANQEALNGRSELPFHLLKREAFEQLAQLPFPDRKNEDWKYTAVSRITGPSYMPAEKQSVGFADLGEVPSLGMDTFKLVFVNGHYHGNLSDSISTNSGLTVLPIESALKHADFRDFVKKEMELRKEKIQHAFQWLNLAFNTDGIYIHLAAKQTIQKPLEIIFLTRGAGSEMMQHPQIIVHQEASSHLTIIERHASLIEDGESLTNAFHAFSLEENSTLYHRKIQHSDSETNIVHHTDVRQARDSQYHSFALDLGGKTVRNNLYVHLEGSNTETHLLGVYLPHDRQSIDNQTFIDHALPHCYSNENYKGIVADRAKAVFNGKVLVRPDAQKTNAFQQNSNLVLSPHAVVDAKPQLEIFADDVKCSHGATIGQLEEEAIFYLRSRGLSLLDAKSMLQEAFVGEVIQEIKEEPIRDFVTNLVRSQLAEISNIEK